MDMCIRIAKKIDTQKSPRMTQSSNADSMPARSPSRSICAKTTLQPQNAKTNPPVDLSSLGDDAKPVGNDQRYHARGG